MPRFNDLLSLGSDCEVSLQLRRLGVAHTPSVFDWLVTPWQAMIRVLHDGGTHLCTRIERGYDGAGAVCSTYGLVYWHEFARDDARQVVLTEATVKAAQDKLRHKIGRMRTVLESEKTVLFVRAGIATDSPSDRYHLGQTFPAGQLNDFTALVSRLFPALKFSLLVVEYEGRDQLQGDGALDPRIVRYSMPCQGKLKPHDAEWDTLMSRIDYGYEPGSGGELAETLY